MTYPQKSVAIPYQHRIASHCESGSVRNLLNHAGIDISEPMVFGIGSGAAFFYLFFAKGPSGLPMLGLRTPPGTIIGNLGKLTGYRFAARANKRAEDGLDIIHKNLENGVPTAISVDMFYMKYLPPFLQVHAPFHYVVVIGRDGDVYKISDPYFAGIGDLPKEDLLAAWHTNAPLTKRNFLFCIERDRLPGAVDLKPAIIHGLKRTCRTMRPPPGIDKMLFFIGIEGMRTFAKKIRGWPRQYQGVRLREGIMFNAVTFEDQGTGGGAFRLMFGAFLQEAAELFPSSPLGDLAGEIIAHGNRWKCLSRKFIKVGKMIPMENGAYPDWYAVHAAELDDGLGELGTEFSKLADFEADFFKRLGRVARTLG